jgi:serine carboxypeptidase-like clade 1
VKKALNIPDSIPRANGTKNDWDLCRNDEDDDFYYESSKQASQWIYEALKGKYRILKYSGDTDAAVPTTGTLWWIDELKLEILEDWRPYFVATDSGMGKSMGGYIREYNGLTLGTVHGAGHMAPQFKPKETYHLLFNWLFQRPV